jgi:hypothetical protein
LSTVPEGDEHRERRPRGRLDDEQERRQAEQELAADEPETRGVAHTPAASGHDQPAEASHDQQRGERARHPEHEPGERDGRQDERGELPPVGG